MTEKRFTIHKESKYKEEWYAYPFCIKEDGEVVLETIPLYIAEKVRDKLNEQQSTIQSLKEENMDLRANHTQMIIIMKDVVRDLKRMDTYRYAEHLEKIANLHFLSEKELEDD